MHRILVLVAVALAATPAHAGGYRRSSTVVVVAPQPVTYVPTVVAAPAAYLPVQVPLPAVASYGVGAAGASCYASGACAPALVQAQTEGYAGQAYAAQSYAAQAVAVAPPPPPPMTYVPTVALPQTAGFTGGYTVNYSVAADPVAALVYAALPVYAGYSGYSGGYSGYSGGYSGAASFGGGYGYGHHSTTFIPARAVRGQFRGRGY